MIDVRILRLDPDSVRERMVARGEDINLVEEALEADQEWRELLARSERLEAKKNKLSGEIGRLKKSGEDTAGLMKQIGTVSKDLDELQQPLNELANRCRDSMHNIPNLPDSGVPMGASAADNPVVRQWGEVPVFGFTPKNHWELGEALRIFDFVRGAKLAGSRFTLYLRNGALLERALIGFMLDLHTGEHGYEEILPPFLVNEETMVGTGQLPKFKADLFPTVDPKFLDAETVERLNAEYFLIPTAEVPLTNIHRREVLDQSDLPHYYCAYTPCFRREAGSYGKDMRGLIRQHQFNKVELVKIVEPESSFEELEKLTRDAETVLQRLGLHYRVVELCTADLGFSAAKTYDIEVWLPGQGTYREISSCSNCTDFQARRALIRYRPAPKQRPQLVHTLNGSGLAVGRTLVAILENGQQEDGSVVVPEALRPYMGGLKRIE